MTDHEPTPDEVAADLAATILNATNAHDVQEAILHALADVLNSTGLTAIFNIECLALVFRIGDRPPAYTVAMQSADNAEQAWHCLAQALESKLQEFYKERGERN